MTNKILYYYKGFLVGLLMVFLLMGGFALANVIINIYENDNGKQIEVEDEMLAGGGPSLRVPWDFKEGIKVDDEYIVDGDRLGYYNITVDGLFDNTATTTGEQANNGVDAYSTTTFAYWENPNADDDVIVEDLYLDNTEAFTHRLASGFKCGTTTSKGSMDIYPFHQWTSSSTDTSGALELIASTSLPTTFNALVDGFIGVQNYPGSAFLTYGKQVTGNEATTATSTKVILSGGEFIVCTWNLGLYSTSSRSMNPATTSGAFTGAVKLKGQAYLRGE